MKWYYSHSADPAARPIADRHYNRQKPGTNRFVPPGRCVVFLSAAANALWVTSWPFAEYVRHAWAGAWICSCFRNESPYLSSDLIREAVAATVAHYGPAPSPHGFITFVDMDKTRRKRDPGRCYLRAGWRYPACLHCDGSGQEPGTLIALRCTVCDGDRRARTKGGLIVLQLPPNEMPPPSPARRWQTSLFSEVA